MGPAPFAAQVLNDCYRQNSLPTRRRSA